MPRGKPQRLAKPTLRELLTRDRKNPLREIGIGDDFKKSQLENAVSDLSFQKLGQAHDALDRQNKLSFVEKRDEHKVPMPRASKAEIIVDAFLGAKPAGERADTERARVDDWNARTNYGRRSETDTYGVTALGGGYPNQSKVSKLLDVSNRYRKVR